MRTGTKRFGAVVCAVGLAAVLVACGGGSSGNGSAAPDRQENATCPLSALPESGEKVKIDLWYANQQGKGKETMQAMVDAYNASQDRVVVSAADQGQGYDAITTKYTQAMPDAIPALVFTDTAMAQFLVDSGTIIPGEVCADDGVVPLDDILPVVKRFFTIDGAYIPGAVNLAHTLDYYNQVSFERADAGSEPPGTLDELRAAAEKIADAGLPDMKWPISTVASPRIFNAFVTAAGHDVVDHGNGHDGRATRAVFDTPEVVDLLGELQSMYDDGLIAQVSNTPGQLDHYLNVSQGKSALVIETSAAATTIEDFLGGGLSAEELESQSLGSLADGGAEVVIGFGPLPGAGQKAPIAFSGGAYYVTNAGSEASRAAAMDFIRYINQPEQQVTWLTEGSFLSGNAKIVDEPDVQKFFSERISGLALQLASDELAAAPADHTGPLVGPFQEYDRIIQSMMEAIMFKGADVADTVASAEADLTAAIADYNEQNDF